MLSVADIRIVAEARPENGVAVRFAYDASLVGALKRSFPKARWEEDRRCWLVPGVRAMERVGAWRAAQVEAAAAVPVVDLSGRADEIRATGVAVPSSDSKGMDLAFPYDAAHVAAVKALPGAKFDASRKAWSVVPPAMDKVDDILAVLRRVGDEVRVRRAAKGKPEVGEMTDTALSMVKGEEMERRGRLRQGRLIVADRSLAVGATFRHMLRWRTVESLGAAWLLDESRAYAAGASALGGKWVQYAYTRVATYAEAVAARAADPSPLDDLMDDDFPEDWYGAYLAALDLAAEDA